MNRRDFAARLGALAGAIALPAAVREANIKLD